MRASGSVLNELYSGAEVCSFDPSTLKRIEDDTSKELTELRKSQEALLKAIIRKEAELQSTRAEKWLLLLFLSYLTMKFKLLQKTYNVKIMLPTFMNCMVAMM